MADDAAAALAFSRSHDIEQFAGNEDDFAQRFAVGVFLDFRAGEGKGGGGFLIGVRGNHQAVTQLAVDLDDELNLVADECQRIMGGPGGFG